jgi:[ribosomal protein S18]-alanine N-acetyltransferase
MIGWLARLLGRGAPVLSAAPPRSAASLAPIHAASFNRGWSDQEFEQLLADRAVVADRATLGRKTVGFIVSRIAADEAEILSVAVTRACRGRGLGRDLLMRNLRRLAGQGVRTVFLEVDEDNHSARKLYARAGFREVGRREGYYGAASGAKAAKGAADIKTTALVLRRDLR